MFANDECGSFVLSCLTNDDDGDMASWSFSIFATTTNTLLSPSLFFLSSSIAAHRTDTSSKVRAQVKSGTYPRKRKDRDAMRQR